MVVTHHDLRVQILVPKELGRGEPDLDGQLAGYAFTYATTDT
jgi:hypothetical protein